MIGGQLHIPRPQTGVPDPDGRCTRTTLSDIFLALLICPGGPVNSHVETEKGGIPLSDASGSGAPATPTPPLSDRSGISRPPAEVSDGVPPSRSPFAIAVNPVGVNHSVRHRAIRFWVRPFEPGDYYREYIVTPRTRGSRVPAVVLDPLDSRLRVAFASMRSNNPQRLCYHFSSRPYYSTMT